MSRHLFTRRMLLSTVAIGCACAFSAPDAPPAAAEGPPPALTIVGQWGGAAGPVAVDGDRAYWAIGARLVVVDVSVPERPRPLGPGLSLPEEPTTIVVDDGTLYLGLGWSGLWTVNVADPRRPLQLGGVVLDGYVIDLAVAGDRAYVALSPEGPSRTDGDAESGLVIVDARRPEAPRPLGGYRIEGYVRMLAVAGGVAWLGWSNYRDVEPGAEPRDDPRPVMVGLDVRDPGNVRSIVGLTLSDLDPDGYIADLVATDGRLLVLCERSLRVMDVAVPASPVLLGRLAWPDPDFRASALRATDGWAVVTGWCNGSGTPWPMSQVVLLDLRRAGTPLILGSARRATARFEPALAADRVWLSEDGSGLNSYSLAAEAAELRPLGPGLRADSTTRDINGAVFDGDRLWLADGSGIDAFGPLGSSSAPSTGSLHLSTTRAVHRLRLDGDVLVAIGWADRDQRDRSDEPRKDVTLDLFDVSGKGQPVHLSSVPTIIQDGVVSQGFLYGFSSFETDGRKWRDEDPTYDLYAADLRDPRRPAPLGLPFDRSLGVPTLVVAGDKLVVSDYGVDAGRRIARWRIFSLANPARPRLVYSGDNSPNGYPTAASGDTLAMAYFEPKLWTRLYDISNPRAPRRLLDLPYYGAALTQVGNWLVAIVDDGLHLVDLAAPCGPAEVARLPLPSSEYLRPSVVARDGLVWVVIDRGGVYAVRLPPHRPTARAGPCPVP